MEQHKIRTYLMGLLIGFGLYWTEQVQALPFEPITRPQAFTVRNLFSWSHKLWGLLQTSRGTKYIDSSDTYLQEQGASFIQSAQNAFARSRGWANYRSYFPPVNWLLGADLRNPWHILALITTTGLSFWGTCYVIKKIRKKMHSPADYVPAQPEHG